MSVNFAKLADYLNRTHLRGQPLLDAEMVSNASLAAGYVDPAPELASVHKAHEELSEMLSAKLVAEQTAHGQTLSRLAALEAAIKQAGIAVVQADPKA